MKNQVTERQTIKRSEFFPALQNIAEELELSLVNYKHYQICLEIYKQLGGRTN